MSPTPTVEQTDGPPRTLAERTADPKRFMHAARTLSVLESDLRAMLEAQAVTGEVVTCASEMYRSARMALVEMLDAADAVDAVDETLGMPELADAASFGELLLVLSQATRWVGIEENWPAMQMAAALQRQQLAGAGEKLSAQLGAALGALELGEGAGSYL
jgi:hypothetical protein